MGSPADFLDSVLAAVHRRMKSSGRLIFNEYTGDCHIIRDHRTVATINRLLETLDPIFLNPDRPRYVNPTLDATLSGDPSEAVRAALILPFLRHRFDKDAGYLLSDFHVGVCRKR